MVEVKGIDFVAAVQYGLHGYGIRRAAWSGNQNCYLLINRIGLNKYVFNWAAGNTAEIARLCPSKNVDLGVDLVADDVGATDWEVV